MTKGVASVPSPVKNLREFAAAAVDHERFVKVVADEFAAAYGLSRDIKASVVPSTPFPPAWERVRRDEHQGPPELTILPGAQRVDASEADRNEYVRAVVEELKVRVTSPGVCSGAASTNNLCLLRPRAVVGVAVRPDTRVYARHFRNALPWLFGALQSSRARKVGAEKQASPLTLSSILATAQEMTIQSRHGVITHVELTRAPRALDDWRAATELCELMVGDRYETLERTREAVEMGGSARHRERMSEMLEWLQREM